MPLFNVYPLYDVTPVSAKGVFVYDENNIEYLDLYGGHAVISIGHGHPKYVKAIKNQVAKLGFYSNAIQNPLQKELAAKIETLSGCKDYELFLCSSGAEANENALKLASFKTEKSRVIAFKNGFHGRTSGGKILKHTTPQEATKELENTIWTKIIKKDDLEENMKRYSVLSRNFNPDNTLNIRVHAATKPSEGFVASKPQLDDAYFIALKQDEPVLSE